MSLLPVADARARLLALAAPLPIETVPLIDAAGRHAAEPVLARRTQPAADLSAMDGYAIRFAERPGPWRIVGESAAGRPFAIPLAPGEAARIFTGAALPPGADTILIQEEATAADGLVRMTGKGPPAQGEHVRRRGADFADGAPLIASGDRLTPARIGLAAAAGHGALPVRRRARVALISTGDELVPPGAPTPDDRLPSSNAPMLAALCGGPLAEIVDLGIVPDDLAALTAAFAEAARIADVVVTIGGASVGDHDLVRPALAAAGAALDFWRVAMRPGKPLMAGRIGDAVVLGLPGNPVSAFVGATLFLKPLLARLSGAVDPAPPMAFATLLHPLPAVGGRTDFLRGINQMDGIRAMNRQDSAGLSSLAAADCLIVRPAGAPPIAAGEQVEIVTLA
ncbi:molybdopterin molybdotransferase MoeA [Sphingomonas naphthae]|uniref:Molybdopterin molybdenumtransferase n=1 Tax=Sphingomonas naphthae TaxID=1813468 RepID=A0ABY7TPY0_9SPHN|nr:gephyrin-like molybdotransferase Glp [Sphingomonas naphthae]WCT75302.1 molybdopterin molybdotransferase MoeA [Sphingomonas naphthae]